MGLADRMRNAARVTNTIEEVREPSLDRSQSTPAASSALATVASGGSQVPEKGDKKPAYASEQDVIASRYYVEDKGGERRYYDDYKRQTLAMRATDTSISSKREDLNTIKAMLNVAAARGWQSVNVKGSAEFRREAWIEGQARGLEVRGHRSSDPDRQEADRRRAERGLSNEVRAPVTSAPVRPAALVTPANPSAFTLDPAHQQAPQRGGEPTKPDPAKGHDHQGKPAPDDHRKIVREAQRELSPDGRIMLSAMSSTIDRQMNKLNSDAKAEMKAYVAGELVKKEQAEGPIVLSAEQKRAANSPEPKPEPVRTDLQERSRAEPEAPRRMIGR